MSASNGSSSSATASATSPPAARCSRAEARNAERAARPGSSWIVCIGTRIRPNSGPESSKPAASACSVRICEPFALRARLELREQVGVEVERGDVVAGAGEVERDPAGARADVEHRARLLRGELAPQRQVGAVAAALDVVPADRAHRQYSLAAPRSESRPRSSSSAV